MASSDGMLVDKWLLWLGGDDDDDDDGDAEDGNMHPDPESYRSDLKPCWYRVKASCCSPLIMDDETLHTASLASEELASRASFNTFISAFIRSDAHLIPCRFAWKEG